MSITLTAQDIIKSMLLVQDQDDSNRDGLNRAAQLRTESLQKVDTFVRGKRGNATALAKSITKSVAEGDKLPAGMVAYTSDQMIGYAAVAGELLKLDGALPDGVDVDTLPMTVKNAATYLKGKGLDKVRTIVRRKGIDLPTAYAEIATAASAQKSAGKPVQTDESLLKNAQKLIDAAIQLDKSEGGSTLADTIVQALIARYSA